MFTFSTSKKGTLSLEIILVHSQYDYTLGKTQTITIPAKQYDYLSKKCVAKTSAVTKKRLFWIFHMMKITLSSYLKLNQLNNHDLSTVPELI